MFYIAICESIKARTIRINILVNFRDKLWFPKLHFGSGICTSPYEPSVEKHPLKNYFTVSEQILYKNTSVVKLFCGYLQNAPWLIPAHRKFS